MALFQIDRENFVSTGGQATAQVTPTALTVVKASPGRLCKVLVQATGTNAAVIQFFDNASAASGTVIGQLPINAPQGVSDFQMPAVNGITIGGVAGSPQMTVSFI